jgi:hypothetical protein
MSSRPRLVNLARMILQLEVPNKFGRAVVWYSKSWRGKVTGQEDGFYIRCFLPGELY